MKKIAILILSILIFTSLMAQKTTVKAYSYTSIVYPLHEVINNSIIHSSFSSPLENLATQYLKNERAKKDPTNTTPISISKEYLDVINIKFDKAISKDLFKTSFTTTDFVMEASHDFDPSEENLDLNKPIFTYSYRSTLVVTDKDGNKLLEKDISNNQSSVFTIEDFYASEFGEKYIPIEKRQPNKDKKVTINVVSSNEDLVTKYSREKHEISTKYKVSQQQPKLDALEAEFQTQLEKNTKSFFESKKTQAIINDLEESKKLLKDNFSYETYPNNMSIYGAKGKYDYEAINTCQENAKEVVGGINAYNENKRTTYEHLNEVLTDCISVWEKEASTVDLKDKKARINKDIYITLQFNIANSYIILGEINKAKEAYEKANKLIERTFMVGTYSLQEQLIKIEDILKLYSTYGYDRLKVIEKK